MKSTFFATLAFVIVISVSATFTPRAAANDGCVRVAVVNQSAVNTNAIVVQGHAAQVFQASAVPLAVAVPQTTAHSLSLNHVAAAQHTVAANNFVLQAVSPSQPFVVSQLAVVPDVCVNNIVLETRTVARARRRGFFQRLFGR